MAKRVAIGLACASLMSFVMVRNPFGASANHYLQCHDSTSIHNPDDFGTHGNPTTGIPPKGYYYLDITACSTTISGTVHTMGDWHLELKQGLSHRNLLAMDEHCPEMNESLIFTGAHIGGHYRFRVENIDDHTVTDTSDFSS